MTLAVLQARMSSSRLPGKVMADLAGAPMILRQIERVRRAGRISRLIVATSVRPDDDPLVESLAAAGVEVVRGDLDDVLSRFIAALDAAGDQTAALRLTADCPLADPTVIDDTIALFERSGADYASNTGDTRTFPKGLDVEVFRTAVLRQAHAETADPYDREHVTPFIYRRPERYRLATLTQDRDEGEVRWTVDRPDDLDFVRAVYDALYPARPAFVSDDVRALVRARPDLRTLGGDPRV
ncbi:cytidylyltransferase domain-containing protein [Caulobacter sp. RL271]|uniref:Glycosyltransferase family protein n=1 Tax=Caulobacter segnis TaxID=88688 RepID=A0ABY5A019_9CAUL|nr:glycosyltransferase family protein [Caulobacter segnis]USQ98386.1 glycosyltransferase family protein [Caulobacter segnis]